MSVRLHPCPAPSSRHQGHRLPRQIALASPKRRRPEREAPTPPPLPEKGAIYSLAVSLSARVGITPVLLDSNHTASPPFALGSITSLARRALPRNTWGCVGVIPLPCLSAGRQGCDEQNHEHRNHSGENRSRHVRRSLAGIGGIRRYGGRIEPCFD